MSLHGYLEDSTEQYGDRVAIRESDGRDISYRELTRLSDGLRDVLVSAGIEPGDRVGCFLPKSVDAVATIFGILKCGAAYVPLDPGAPIVRNAFILADCRVKAVLVEQKHETALLEELKKLSASPVVLALDSVGAGEGLDNLLGKTSVAPTETVYTDETSLAYILYTSGSTGRPKGVMVSHRNATSFVDWCLSEFSPVPEDRFSSHAPFHFDLSILDIYTAIGSGASIALIDEALGKNPAELAAYISNAQITVWYSAPSILALLAQFGDLTSRDYSKLRLVLFAGEVFPIVHLRSLKKLWPHPLYFNLYGPTETNVCTYYPIPTEVPEDRKHPYPIGSVCSHLEGMVIGQDDTKVAVGEEGELCIRGASVTQGYWELPEQTAAAFLEDPDGAWYRTGDLVHEDSARQYVFAGRRDRMVKKRGFRVELDEIEACLYNHPKVFEAAVVAVADQDMGTKISAYLVARGSERISMIELKTFCSKHLPKYMIPDFFSFESALPKTSTDKIDYQRLLKKSS